MKALLAGLPDYWLNFGLHTLLVSLFAWLACRLIRDPGRRAFFAAVGIAGIVSLPWVSALRLFEKLPQPITSAQESIGTSFPEWTIRIENADAVPPSPVSVPPLVVSEATPINWNQALAIIWIVGVAISFGLLAFRQWKLMRWAHGHRKPTEDEWEVVGEMDVERHRIRVSTQASTPCVIGFFSPLVIVPRFLFGNDMRAEVTWALRHEGEHLRSGDSRMAVLLSIARSVMWWNPFIHSLCATWSEDRERVCDARATENLIDRRRYGSFLLDLSELQETPMKGAVSMASSAGRMRKRLRAILRGDRVKEGSLAFQIASFLLIAGAGSIASFAGVGRTHAAEAAPPPTQDIASPPMPPPPVETGKQPDPQGSKKTVVTSQVKITTTFLETTYEIPEAGSVLDEEDLQLLMRRCAQTAGTDLMTSPSIAMRDQQKGSVEIIRTDPKAAAKHGVEETRKAPFVGLSMEVQPEVIGDHLRLSIDCLFHFAGETKFSGERLGGEWPATPAKDFDWSKVRAVQAKATKDLKSGETLVLAFEGEDKGRYLTGFFTATRIDAAGRTLDDKGNVLEAPNPEWHGKSVRMSAAIVDVPADGKLGPYWLKMGEGAAKPWSYEFLYPASHFPALLAEARKRGADRVTELGTSIVSADSPARIWPRYGAEIGIGFTGTQILQLRMLLPEIGEIKTSGYVGYLIGGEIVPDANGRRRWLLLSMEDPGP